MIQVGSNDSNVQLHHQVDLVFVLERLFELNDVRVV